MVNRVTSPRLAACGVTGRPLRRGHAGDPQRAADAAGIEDVRLDDVDGGQLADAPPGRELAVLLAAGHGDVERVRHLPGLLQLPVGARLLVMLDPLGLEQPPDLDRARRREAAVGVDQKMRLGPERLADRRHDRLGPPRPFVDVVPALGADPELEGIEAVLVAQAQEALGLGLGRDVALHRRGVGTQPPGRAAEQLDHRLAVALAAQVPERRVEPGHRALEVGARELVLLLLDPVDQLVDREDSAPSA